ncbi:SCP2 sterol-binding domain-containing protein [Streptomyces sp. NPDC059456]|uniref:SCP2 sterol-binding domain-containing protein n=1 Tax=Streptomyces sp. NPDC059456 TaxID=3346838 RepID=UPI00369E1B1F
MVAVDVQRLFNEELPARFVGNPEKAKQVGGKFQINVTGDGGGEWFVDATESGPCVTQGNPGGADVTMTMAVEDFQKLYENPQAQGMQLFFAGKMKLVGNQQLAMKLQSLFRVGD